MGPRPCRAVRAGALHVRRTACREAVGRLHARRYGHRPPRRTRARPRRRAGDRREGPRRRLAVRDGQTLRHRCRLPRREEALQLHGGYGYLHGTASRRSSATCASTRSSRARTRSCASSSAASCWDPAMTRVAFLGLGHMGLPMALNLAKAGHEVIGFDVVPAAIDAARAGGLVVADAGTDAAASADVVITMFPSGRHVIDAYRDGLLAATARGRCSSTAPRSLSTRPGTPTRSPRPPGIGVSMPRLGWGGRRGERDARVHGRRLG